MQETSIFKILHNRIDTKNYKEKIDLFGDPKQNFS